MSQQRQRGTSFETNVVRYMRAALSQPDIERRALHGSRDMGDIYRIMGQNGLEGIAECKDHRTVTDSLIDRWRAQTLSERDEAHADFGLLVIHRRGKSSKSGAPSFGQNIVQVTVEDLLRLAGTEADVGDVGNIWVSMRLVDACSILLGGDASGRLG